MKNCSERWDTVRIIRHGIGSVEPAIPEPDFLKKLQGDKREVHEGQYETFRYSSYLQELLKKSKDNAAMHKKQIDDKYCERGAEWGVSDCALLGMNRQQRENFMKVLKRKKNQSPHSSISV